ncbi:MAG: transcription-repair coupling factor [Eubacteriales bacterium]|nr:transcription-repair coupling factor [Eubacteriales bacterium]
MYNALRQLDTYNDLERELKQLSAPLSVSGCMESQKLQLSASLLESLGAGWLLYVTPDERGVTLAAEDFKTFNKNVWTYPARDLLFYSSDIHGSFVSNQRVDAMKHLIEDKGGVFITTIDALMEKIRPKKEFISDKLHIFEGMVITTTTLSRELTRLGYKHAAEVSAMGEYAVRGGIVDIFPMTMEEPYRIEFFDDEIDTIRSFDAASQRSIERIPEFELYPAEEAVYVAGRAEEVSLLTYFGADDLVVIDNPVRAREWSETLEKEFAESVRLRLEKGITEEERKTADIFSAAEIFESLKSRRCMYIAGLDERLSEFGAKKDFHFNTAAAGSYKESIEMLISDIKGYLKQGYRITVLTPSRTRASRLAENLREYEISAYCPDADGREAEKTDGGSIYSEKNELKTGTVEVVCGNLRQGYIYPTVKYALMTESEMFGTRTGRKRRKKKHYEGDKLISLNELNYGDYVVHEEHGIGVYRGLEHIVREGSGKDYIKIEYADGGNLYLPATKLDLIQKYADSTAKKPKLNKLNGTEWTKTRQRVNHAVNDIARELIELYAKRLNGRGFKYSPDSVWQREFEELFPYEETEDQLSAIAAVKNDMESGRIMDRLICGDVGFGKTEIAIRAAFKAVQDGKQVIFLVPTTILAQQHYNTFVERLGHYPIKIEMMSRFRTSDQNKKLAARLKDGSVDIVIGTHRLLSKDVGYKDPGLLIIDEEQRFGVAHKEKIKQLKNDLDVLSLTATPIPRTLHMSLSGIRDLSTLEEPPFDRVPIQTYVMEYNDEYAREAISRELARNGQVFYVYNHVQGIREKTSHLQALLPDARVEYAHGQMNERELEDIMMEFVNGEIDVLVSTTIVETGLDIPNANTLIVDGAERMGLSQLYQLRGRVGRSNKTAYAFLMYRKDKVLSEEAEKRLKAIREFTELGAGIKIAMRDLEIRGAGNVLGAEQHGQMQAVGYDLYCKLLSKAVRLLQKNGNADEAGLSEPVEVNTGIDCDIDAYIPDSYISNEYQKLDFYKRIAEISTEAEYSDMQDELTDRYGDVPREVQALLDIVMLKEKAKKAYVTDLNIRSGNIIMAMHPRADIKVEAIPELLKNEHGKLKFLRGQNPRFVYQDEKAGYHGPAFMMKKAAQIIEQLIKDPA